MTVQLRGAKQECHTRVDAVLTFEREGRCAAETSNQGQPGLRPMPPKRAPTAQKAFFYLNLLSGGACRLSGVICPAGSPCVRQPQLMHLLPHTHNLAILLLEVSRSDGMLCTLPAAGATKAAGREMCTALISKSKQSN